MQAPTTQPLTLSELHFLVGGEWRADTKWANGNPFKAGVRFESVFDGKFIRGESWTIEPAGERKPRDLVFFSQRGVHLVQHVFNADGNTREAIATGREDASLTFEWTRDNADGTTTPLKLIVTKLDDNRHQQRVMMFIRGEWHTLLDATWTR